MNSGINLLGNKKQVVVSPAVRKLRLVRGIAIGLLSFVAFSSMVLFLLIYFSPLPALQKQEHDALQTMAQYHPEVAKIELVNDRLDSSAEIIDNRKNFDQKLAAVRDQMPSELSFVAMSMKEKVMSITVASSSLSALNTFIDKLVTAADNNKDFSKVTLVTISDSGKSYFTLTVELVIL